MSEDDIREETCTRCGVRRGGICAHPEACLHTLPAKGDGINWSRELSWFSPGYLENGA